MTKVERTGSTMLSGFFGVHPNTDLLLQEWKTTAAELEREGNHKAAGERGGVRVMHIRKDAMWPQLAIFSPRTYLSQVRDVTFFKNQERPRSPRTRTKSQHGAVRVFDHFMARTEEDAFSRKTIWTVSRTRDVLSSHKGIYKGQVEQFLLHTRPLLAI